MTSFLKRAFTILCGTVFLAACGNGDPVWRISRGFSKT